MKKRLRKKKHLKEFRQLGFGLDFQTRPHLSWEASMEVVSRAIAFIDQGGRECSGGSCLANEFSLAVCRRGSTSATEEDRTSVEQWLRTQPEIVACTVGPLVDVWY
jgi:uncharacterized protein YggL (DUF469 family)